MSLEDALNVLVQLEQRVRANQARFKIRGIFRPRIVLEVPDGEIVGEIRAGAVCQGFSHKADCRVLETDMSIHTVGFFKRSYSLQSNGSSLLSVDTKLCSGRYFGRDWQETAYQLCQRGCPWSQRFELVNNGPEKNVIQFRFSPLHAESSLFVSLPGEIKPGLTVGLAILLYYNWYLSLRTGFLSMGGAGG